MRMCCGIFKLIKCVHVDCAFERGDEDVFLLDNRLRTA